MPGLLLMENAARSCVDVLLRLGISGPIGICCGRGNNGGDGFAMARRLDLLGYPVKVFFWGKPEKLTGDAATNFQILTRTDIPILTNGSIDQMPIDFTKQLEAELIRADWIVDALLGTGFQGPLRPPLIDVIRRLNQSSAKRLAVDLPSGLDCDLGTPSVPTFRADHTCTFVAEKVGFQNLAAKSFLGTIHVVDIGAPRKLFA